MAGRNEIGVVYRAGLAQGVALVTFPAAIYRLTAIVAVAMGPLSFFVVRGRRPALA